MWVLKSTGEELVNLEVFAAVRVEECRVGPAHHYEVTGWQVVGRRGFEGEGGETVLVTFDAEERHKAIAALHLIVDAMADGLKLLDLRGPHTKG